MKGLRGIHSALVTPFGPDGGLDLEVVPKLVDFELAQGIDGFYVGGSTGEAFLQSPQERIAFLGAVADAVGDRGTLIAHVGAVSTQEAVALAKGAEQTGYQAISALPPFYYEFTSQEVITHYRRLVDSVGLPLIVYNFPARMKHPLSLADLTALLATEGIVGVKHTSQDLYQLERLKRANPEALIFSGFDEMCLAGLAMGADGAIGTTFNFMGRLFVALTEAMSRGDLVAARALQSRANKVIDVLSEVGVFAGTKAMLTLLGIDCGACRAPFSPLDQESLRRLQAILPHIEGQGI